MAYEWEVVACLSRKKTKKPYDGKRIDQDMVVNWKAVHNMMQVNNVTKNVDGEKVNWKSTFETMGITWLRYEKERPQTILYKHDTYSTSVSFKEIDTVSRANKKKYVVPCTEDLPHAYDGLIPIPYKKYKDLMKLCDDLVIPRRFHSFYNSLICGKQSDNKEDVEVACAQLNDKHIDSE